jgi:hypothetical protein
MSQPNKKQLFTVIEDIFPLENYPQNNYAEMPQYNSNRTIPAFNSVVPPPPAAQFINNLEKQNPGQRVVNGVYLPRTTSFIQNSIAQTAPINQYSQFTIQPPFAGGLPYLKNALQQDKNIVMNPYGYPGPVVYANDSMQHPLSSYPNMYPDVRDWRVEQPKQEENFRFNANPTNSSSVDCTTILHHCMNCEHCKKLLSCDNRTNMAILILLVLLFVTVLYLMNKGT